MGHPASSGIPERSSQYAALVNGTSSHSIEMDDVTTTSSLHPGVAAFPAALALAEELDASPRDVIAAVVAGYEVIMRVGDAINGSEAYKVGFHPTAVAGVFGAAAIGASLLRLDREHAAHALGIAGQHGSRLDGVSDRRRLDKAASSRLGRAQWHPGGQDGTRGVCGANYNL